RLAMVLAVLEARAGVRLGQHDVYMNVAGGFRIMEPAADLAVAAALVSSLADVPIPAQMALFGEVSLSGLVRPVPQAAARLKEAVKLGFTQALLPEGVQDAGAKLGLALHPVRQIADVVAKIAGGKAKPRSSASISG
ncbi:MAG: DNA repair protein RadA, partial [Methylobacterium sp.]|nr:DNA repair protein RadA [Methylobacterium sp.]